LLEEIARGGMGVVYKARQISLHRLVALKMILSGQLASPSEVQRFRTEAEAAAQLDHPNIVPIYEVGEHNGQHYFSMKLVEGPNLAQSVAEYDLRSRDGKRPASGARAPGDRGGRLSGLQWGGRAPHWVAARLLAKVARAVHYAHQRGVLHRDIKPTNILLDGRGEPQLTDFGLARVLEKESSLTQSQAVLGSANYMSPEQAQGRARQLTTATDVYGLGAVLYELLAGRPPIHGETFAETLRHVIESEPLPPSKIVRESAAESAPRTRRAEAERRRSQPSAIDKDLETICLKCLSKDPEQRYGSAEALAMDLEHWLAGEPIQARPIRRTAKAWRWCRRNPLVSSLGAAALVLLLAVAIGSPIALFRINHQRQRADAEAARARRAEQETREQLWRSYLDQARATRWSGRLGRRADSLDVLKKAAAIRPSLELRNEAIACLTLSDARKIREVAVPAGVDVALNAQQDLYARHDHQGKITVHRLSAFRGAIKGG
jgi:serine/threonine-protein kinase